MPHGLATNSPASVNQIGQQVAKEHVSHINASILERIYSPDSTEFNFDVVSPTNGGLNGGMETDIEAETNCIKRLREKLEPDQRLIFDDVVRLMLQRGEDGEASRLQLILGPAGSGKTHLISAVLDAAKRKSKDYIRTSFKAMLATAIGGNTFTGEFFWQPATHHHRSSPLTPEQLIK
jgi:hypothetical protein